MIIATLDTGALVAMERGKERGAMLLRASREHRVQLLAITPVVAEWWRGRSDVRDRIKLAVTLVPFPLRAAEAAGMALGKIRGERERARLAVDVMVMAFAATYGDALVYTGDVGDLQRSALISPRFVCSVSEGRSPTHRHDMVRAQPPLCGSPATNRYRDHRRTTLRRAARSPYKKRRRETATRDVS